MTFAGCFLRVAKTAWKHGSGKKIKFFQSAGTGWVSSVADNPNGACTRRPTKRGSAGSRWSSPASMRRKTEHLTKPAIPIDCDAKNCAASGSGLLAVQVAGSLGFLTATFPTAAGSGILKPRGPSGIASC